MLIEETYNVSTRCLFFEDSSGNLTELDTDLLNSSTNNSEVFCKNSRLNVEYAVVDSTIHNLSSELDMVEGPIECIKISNEFRIGLAKYYLWMALTYVVFSFY